MSKFRGRKSLGILYVTEYEQRGTRLVTIDEKPPIHDMNGFEFDFDEEKQVPIIYIRKDRNNWSDNPYYIVNDSEWQEGWRTEKNWNWAPADWRKILELGFADSRLPKSLKEFGFGQGIGTPTQMLIWDDSRDGVPIEEAAGALVDFKLKGFITDVDELNDLFEEALKDMKKDDDRFKDMSIEEMRKDEEIVQEAQDQATQDMTYTESGYIASDEWYMNDADDQLIAAAYYICRMIHPTDEDLEIAEPSEDMVIL